MPPDSPNMQINQAAQNFYMGKTALWSNVECERRLRGNNQCTNVMQAVPDYCWPDK